MAATLLAKGTVTLRRVPRITDVSVMWSLLEALGARIRYEGDNVVTIDFEQRRFVSRAVRAGSQARRVVRHRRSAAGTFRPRRSSASGRMRARHASDRYARASVRRAGVRSPQRARILDRRVAPPRLQGASIEFRMPSVGATKNAMLAAAVADGVTTLKNAAMEPEVVDLADFLVAMGAKIRGSGDRHDRDRGRDRTARHGVRNHSGSNRHRNAAACRRDYARRRDGYRLSAGTPAQRARQIRRSAAS